MSYETIARRYAQAVFELGKESGKLAEVSKEISAMADVLQQSEELRAVLTNPLVEDAAREAILVEIGQRIGLGDTSLRTIRVLAQNRRLGALPEIGRTLARMVDAESKTLRAVVTSAGALSEGYLSRLGAELTKATGQKIILTVRTDPTLIAGVVVQIGDRVIDGSVRAKLSRFRDGLSQTS